MKNKHTIILFLIGLIYNIIGALFKITHIEIGFITGNLLLIIGMAIQILAIILFIIKLLKNKKTNEFLNQ